jgi:CRISPR/Cas system-associated exonuclease Cas4 (RecB family)
MIRIFEAPSARDRLDAAASFVRKLAPGTEALLVGATREAVDDFVRELSLELGATFGLHRFSFLQIAALFASEEVARRNLAPATALGMEAVCARATFEAFERGAIPRLAAVSSFPGFPRSLAATLQELRFAELEPQSLRGENANEVATLLECFEDELSSAGIADRATLFRLAAVRLEREDRPFAGAPVLLLDVAAFGALEGRFLHALLRGARGVFATVPSGDEDAREVLSATLPLALEPTSEPPPSALARLQRFLFAVEAPPEEADDETVRFLSAPGEGRECVEIARAILEEAMRGVRFDKMAVFLRAPEVYSSHLETTFRRAGIPVYFARGTKRPDPSGRAFLALLACKAEGLSAKRFAEYLSFGQVPRLDDGGAPPEAREIWIAPEDEALGPAGAIALQLSLFPEEQAGGPVAHRDSRSRIPKHIEPDPPGRMSLRTTGPPGPLGVREPSLPPDSDEMPQIEGSLRAPWKWEEYLVEAAVIGGKDRWRRRLGGLEAEIRLKIQTLENEEPGSAKLPALKRDLANVGHLERFALPVIEILDGFPRFARWGEWLTALAALASRVLRDPERVIASLAEMRPMNEVGPVGIDEVRVVLGRRLSTLEEDLPAHRYGRVFVATPDQARGRSFRTVFVPGLAERIFPQRPREDPLFLDAARERVSKALRTQKDRGRAERLLLRLAVGASEERVVLSYPRVDVVEARPRVPSFYGLDVARATRGVLPDYEELEREAAARVNARLAWPSPADPDRAIDPVEHDLAVLGPLLHGASAPEVKGRARYLLEINETLGRSLRSRWVRWRSPKWSPEDGIVRVTESIRQALEQHRPHARAYSVTSLEKFAACPYRFLLSAVHRLEPREDAVALIQMDPLTRGRLIHEIQARTLRALREMSGLPVTGGNLEQATELLDDTVRAVAEEYREDLAPAIARVWEDEVEAVRGDLRVWLKRMSEEGGEWIPRNFEFTFGLPHDSSYDAESVPDPVTLPGGWKIRGAVDLIEARANGETLRVTDHKTGVNRTNAGWIVGGGETLQPVLYSLAVEAATGREVEKARLFFCTTRGGFTERAVEMNEWSRMYGRRVLEIIDRAVERGTLPPSPKRGACSLCDFRIVCGPHEEMRARSKMHALVADLEALRDLP